MKPGTPLVLSFSIVNDEGATLKSFQIDREKLLHFIVVRKDLQEFQHVHPDLNTASGIFTLKDFVLPTPGPYKLYADFVTSLSQTESGGQFLNAVVMKDITVAGSYTPQALGIPVPSKTVDGYGVALKQDPAKLSAGENMLSFSITKDGVPITDLEDYLAALGHAVIVREGTLDYIHAHAVQDVSAKQDGRIDFHVEFPTSGAYKVFLQFKRGGKVSTADFVVTVGEETGSVPETMNHSMH